MFFVFFSLCFLHPIFLFGFPIFFWKLFLCFVFFSFKCILYFFIEPMYLFFLFHVAIFLIAFFCLRRGGYIVYIFKTNNICFNECKV